MQPAREFGLLWAQSRAVAGGGRRSMLIVMSDSVPSPSEPVGIEIRGRPLGGLDAARPGGSFSAARISGRRRRGVGVATAQVSAMIRDGAEQNGRWRQ